MITVSYNIIIVQSEQKKEDNMNHTDSEAEKGSIKNSEEQKRINLAWLKMDFLRGCEGLMAN